jgi:hypothetical protein
MFKINDDIKVYITSDTHYGHKNICRGVTDWRMPDGSIPINQTRDFDTINKMNDAIVNNINSFVGQDDILIHLGDWSFGGYDNIKRLRDRIVCQNIHLTFGNHDHHIKMNRDGCKSLFTSTQDYLEVQYMGYTVIMMHYPITSWDGVRKGHIHLHGHVHLPHHAKISGGRRMDVGLDGNPGFRPYDFHKECLIPLTKLPIGTELGAEDHHTDKMKNIVG